MPGPHARRGAVRRFVDEVFFATQFLAEDIHAEAKARANRLNAAQASGAPGVLGASEIQDSGNDVRRPNSGDPEDLITGPS